MQSFETVKKTRTATRRKAHTGVSSAVLSARGLTELWGSTSSFQAQRAVHQSHLETEINLRPLYMRHSPPSLSFSLFFPRLAVLFVQVLSGFASTPHRPTQTHAPHIHISLCGICSSPASSLHTDYVCMFSACSLLVPPLDDQPHVGRFSVSFYSVSE